MTSRREAALPDLDPVRVARAAGRHLMEQAVPLDRFDLDPRARSAAEAMRSAIKRAWAHRRRVRTGSECPCCEEWREELTFLPAGSCRECGAVTDLDDCWYDSARDGVACGECRRPGEVWSGEFVSELEFERHLAQARCLFPRRPREGR